MSYEHELEWLAGLLFLLIRTSVQTAIITVTTLDDTIGVDAQDFASGFANVAAAVAIVSLA